MVRNGSLRGDTPYWLAMARYDTPGVRHYASVCVGSGFPVWLVMVRFAGVRECAASRHLLRPVEEPGQIWRVFSPGVPGRRIPDRLDMSRYVAPPARVIPGVCGSFFPRVSGCIRAVWLNRAVRALLGLRVSRCVSRSVSRVQWRAWRGCCPSCIVPPPLSPPRRDLLRWRHPDPPSKVTSATCEVAAACGLATSLGMAITSRFLRTVASHRPGTRPPPGR